LYVKINYMEMSKTALNKAPLTFIGDTLESENS